MVAPIPLTWYITNRSCIFSILRHINGNETGIEFDDSAFRNSENGQYQRKLIPSFLERTQMDISTVIEYARNYNIEGMGLLILC